MIQEATRPAAPGLTAGPASPGAECLAPVRDLPGLAHACLLDESDGRVLAAIGVDEGTAAAVLAWGRRAGTVATDRGLALDDLIVTTDAAHHLLRAVHGPAQGPWVYLRVRREDGNLARARRQLAAVTTAASTTSPSGPSVPARSSSAPGAIPFPRRQPAVSSARPWARPPAASPAARTPLSPPAAVPAPPVPPVPPALPAPRASPGATAPAPPAPAATPSAPTPAPAALPAGPPPADPATSAGWRAAVRDSAGVLGQRWRTDPETLRRVLAGLLGLGPGPQALTRSADPTTTRSPGATPTRRNP